jgi:hypothetical protein
MTSDLVSHGELAEIRRQLLRVLDSLDHRPANQGAGARVRALVRNQVIPRRIAALMTVLLEIRNSAEYEDLAPTCAEGQVVRSAWQAIQDWNTQRGRPNLAA